MYTYFFECGILHRCTAATEKKHAKNRRNAQQLYSFVSVYHHSRNYPATGPIMSPLLQRILPLITALPKKKSTWLGVGIAILLAYLATGSLLPTVDWLWKEPRELLVDRVEAARDSQQEGAEQFRDALSEFKAVVDLPDSDLERQYTRIDKAYQRSQDAADEIHTRVDRVVAASNRLLKEWRTELDDYNDPSLRRLAEAQFDETRVKAEQLIASMRKIESRMQPVLTSFRDQVLYLKHNLNLSAIAALEGEAIVIAGDVDTLIADMNRAIAEADAFIRSMLEQGET